MPYLDKRTRLNSLTTWCQTELDTLTAVSGAGSIAEMIVKRDAAQSAVTTIEAIAAASRTTNQKVDLAQARAEVVAWRGRIEDARRWVRVARLALLLDGGRARPQDITGSDG